MKTAAFLATLGAMGAVARPAKLAKRDDATDSLGITYDVFNADSSCKTQDQVNTDFGSFGGYAFVRIYGTECNQVAMVNQAASAAGMRVMAGVYDLSTATDDLNTIIGVFQSNWANLDTVTIGNELVNDGTASVDDVVNALNAGRTQMRNAGYQGPVVTVDTFNAIIANPDLCSNSDYAAANAHAFFDPTTTAEMAGTWAVGTAQNIANACPGKSVVITESGWPHQGDTNGDAVPGVQQQADAIAGLKGNFSSGGMTIFNSFDDLWKTNNAYTFGAEQYWGIFPTPSYSNTEHKAPTHPNVKQYDPVGKKDA